MGAEQHYWDASRGQLNKATPSETIRITAQPSPVCELIFVPQAEAFAVLTQQELEQLLEAERAHDDAVRKVQEAVASQDTARIEAAKNEWAQCLAKGADGDASTNSGSAKGGSAKPNSPPKLTELVRFNGRKWAVAPAPLVERFMRDPRRLFKLENLLKLRDAVAAGSKLSRKDATGLEHAWRNPDGTLNKKAIKERFGKVSSSINAEFQLVEPRSGRIPVKYLWGIGGAAIIDRSELLSSWADSLDNLIDKVNENLNWQYEQYRGDRDEALKRLAQKEFDEDDLGFVQSAVQEIWEGDEAAAAWVEQVGSLRYPLAEPARRELHQALEKQPLPPARYDASAEAQLMRYACGVTMKANFDPAKGQISASADAKLDLALFDGKAKGRVYLPHKAGAELSLDVTKIEYKPIWEPCPGEDGEASSLFPGRVQFEFDREFVSPTELAALASALAPVRLERAIKEYGQSGEVRIQIVGHADQAGRDPYNDALSQRRAQAIYALLRRDVRVWLQLFLDGVWGDRESAQMLDFVVGARAGESRVEQARRFQGVMIREQLPQLGSPPRYTAVALREQGLAEGFVRMDGSLSSRSENGRRTLIWLISEYFRLALIRSSLAGLPIEYFTADDFHETPTLWHGERRPLPGQNTGGRNGANRRVEFHAYRVAGLKEERRSFAIDFGCMRFTGTGSISLYAGANLLIGAKIEVATRYGLLAATGQKTTPGGKLAGTAFAGAKATVGIKGALEWKPPKPVPAPGRLDEATKVLEQEFLELGSVGYTATGSAGAGLEGEIKIGFDETSLKFVIKVKAGACLGVGFSGSVEFTVGAKHVYSFVMMVYEQLEKADFSYIDLFESAKVFDLFTAWAYELIRRGNAAGGLVALTVIGYGRLGVEIAQQGKGLRDKWLRHSAQIDDTHSLIDALEAKPNLLRYCAPETKGRMLHVLVEGFGHKDLHLGGRYGWGASERREAAILLIMEHGIRSARDYQETLEHMGIGIPHSGLSTGQEMPEPERQRLLAERAKRAATNEARLLAILDGAEEKRFLELKARLPNKSGA